MLFTGFLLAGCSGGETRRTTLEWEAQPFYVHDLPRFQLQVFPHSGSESGVDVFFSFSTESLIFVADTSGFHSSILLEIQVLDSVKEGLVAEKTWKETIHEVRYDDTRVRKEQSFQRRIPVDPGSYLIRVLVTDTQSKKTAVRQRRVRVQGSVGDRPLPGEIRFRTDDPSGTKVPFLGLTLGSPPKRLYCSMEIHNAKDVDSLTAKLSLIRFRIDTTLPSLPYAFSATRGSLEHSGIDLSGVDTLRTLSIPVRNPGPMAEVDWEFVLEDEGIYLIRGGGEYFRRDFLQPQTMNQTQRPVAMMSGSFPSPAGIDDLIAPLVYIAREEEMDSLRSLTDPAEKRRAFELFWLGIAGSKTKASTMIRQYYTRVEEANIHFSSFKEGWRTDRGMMYIMFGPPVSVQGGMNGVLWNYGAVEGEKLNSYYFRRIPLPAEFEMFDHFVLERQAYYDQPWIAAVERWRRGAGF